MKIKMFEDHNVDVFSAISLSMASIISPLIHQIQSSFQASGGHKANTMLI
jgi:hypothetical protein